MADSGYRYHAGLTGWYVERLVEGRFGIFSPDGRLTTERADWWMAMDVALSQRTCAHCQERATHPLPQEWREHAGVWLCERHYAPILEARQQGWMYGVGWAG